MQCRRLNDRYLTLHITRFPEIYAQHSFKPLISNGSHTPLIFDAIMYIGFIIVKNVLCECQLYGNYHHHYHHHFIVIRLRRIMSSVPADVWRLLHHLPSVASVLWWMAQFLQICSAPLYNIVCPHCLCRRPLLYHWRSHKGDTGGMCPPKSPLSYSILYQNAAKHSIFDLEFTKVSGESTQPIAETSYSVGRRQPPHTLPFKCPLHPDLGYATVLFLSSKQKRL